MIQPEKNIKPLGKRSYGSIPHFSGSRLGPGDHYISLGQEAIATKKKRDKYDVIIVQEKLDGSNTAVLKLNNEILAITRAGYIATTSPYKQHHLFSDWVNENKLRFSQLLNEGERICGEWLALAHGTIYNLPHEPFVPFDLMTGVKRVPYLNFCERVNKFDFTTPKLLSIGEPFSIDKMIEATKISGHGALDPVEGAIWRVERNGDVDFLAKYVSHFKQDGKYFAEVTGKDEVWNYHP